MTSQAGFGKTKVALLALGYLFLGGMLTDAQTIVTVQDLYRQPVSAASEGRREPRSEEQSALDSINAITVDDLLNSRKLRWNAEAGTSWIYNSNLFSASKAISDQILSLNGGLAMTYGESGGPLNVTGNFGMSYSQYQKFTQYSGIGQTTTSLHAVWLAGGKTTVTGDLYYGSGRGSSLGGSVQEQSSSLNSSLGVRYQTTNKVSSGFDFGYSTQVMGSNQNYVSERVHFITDYQCASKLQLGIGLGGGARTLNTSSVGSSPNSDETDQSAQMRLNYQVTDKMSINGDAGWENRSAANGASKGAPRCQGSWQYSPLDGTSIALTGYKRVDANAGGTTLSMGQALGCTGTISQRLFQRIFLNISGGLESFKQDNGNFSTNANARNIHFLGASLSSNVLRWVDGSVFCRTSTSSGSTIYNQTTVGIQLTAHY